MDVVKLRIDGQEFYLEPEADLPALQQQVIAAVAGRGAFVEFTPIGRGRIAVLVTQHTPVRFEVEQHSADEVHRWTEDPPPVDLHDVFPDLTVE